MIDLYHTRNGTVAMDGKPHLCKVCKTEHWWLKNINGETVCIHCAVEEEQR